MNKKVTITILAVFIALFCEAQNTSNELERVTIEVQRLQSEQKNLTAEIQRLRNEQNRLETEAQRQPQTIQGASEAQRLRESRNRLVAEERRVNERLSRLVAEEQPFLEEQTRLKTELEKQAAIEELEHRYQFFIQSAQEDFGRTQYAHAKQSYKDALELKPENATWINAKIAEIDRILLEILYQDVIESAENNFKQRKFTQAKQDYRSALDYKPENASFVNSKIAEIDKIILEEEKRLATETDRERRYQEAISSAQRNFNRQLYTEAKLDYQNAGRIKPENISTVNNRIAEIDRIVLAEQQRKEAERKATVKKKAGTWLLVGGVAIVAIISYANKDKGQ